MYIVRFVRADRQPCEEYQYLNKNDAMYHFSLFEEDDSCLYSSIEVVKIDNNCELQFAKIHLSS